MKPQESNRIHSERYNPLRFSTGASDVNKVSLILSEVLDDIGVNEEMVKQRRQDKLMIETITTMNNKMNHDSTSLYIFGSQSEGTTTLGLDSDHDHLYGLRTNNVITDLKEWKCSVNNLLVVQNESIPSGYCFLQQLASNIPEPLSIVPNEDCTKDDKGRILWKNSWIVKLIQKNQARHGPSLANDVEDIVPAYYCHTFLPGTDWLRNRGTSKWWPTIDMIEYAFNKGCFLVPVGKKGSQTEFLEWRISTSQAERCLMFSLNITQIRCYILLKMVVKTHLKFENEQFITSFMCKTTLFHCIQQTDRAFWHESNLLLCFTLCLEVLYNFTQLEFCPHLFVPKNNLMEGQFSFEVKSYLIKKMLGLINNNGVILLSIKIDDVGQRLLQKFDGFFCSINQLSTPEIITLKVYADLLKGKAQSLCAAHSMLLNEIRKQNFKDVTDRLLQTLSNLSKLSKMGNDLEKTASVLLTPLICSTLGSIVASSDIGRNETVSNQACIWLYQGIKSDASSSKLKLASVYYLTGNIKNAESILLDVKEQLSKYTLIPVCQCSNRLITRTLPNELLKDVKNVSVVDRLKGLTSLCVKFLRLEKHCTPQELQYEMFRSTFRDRESRDGPEKWMENAVVYSVPYLYFLQYKTYRHLGKQELQKEALNNLRTTTDLDPNMSHKETALNLAGQCLEDEGKHLEALQMYLKSLEFCPTDNSARIHICKLLSRLCFKSVIIYDRKRK